MSIHRTEPATPPAGEHLPALAQWVERAMELADAHAHESWSRGCADRIDVDEKGRAALRAHLSALPPVAAPRLSDEQIDALQEQFDCFGDVRIHDFARALLNLAAPLAERPQGARQEDSQEDSFNQPVNDAQGASPASRSRAPSGEESAPTERETAQVERVMELAAQWGDARVRGCYPDDEDIDPAVQREALRRYLDGILVTGSGAHEE